MTRRLLAGIDAGPSLSAHLETFGQLPDWSAAPKVGAGSLLDLLAESQLLGRGGSGVPAALKAQFHSRVDKPTVVVNCTEGEPASRKDVTLATRAPHLILDGAAVLATALGSSSIIVAVADDMEKVTAALKAAVAERPDRRRFSVVTAPARYITGEESALIHFLSDGVALPTFRPIKPSYLTLKGRTALVHNAETMAQLALIARYGADWFHGEGTPSHPGTTLVTVSGGVRQPGVIEWSPGGTLRDLLDASGGVSEGFGGALVGGYGGSWVGPDHLGVEFSRSGLDSIGATFGPGIVVVLPEHQCPVAELARIVRYMAGESAGQCGPCVLGLPALARDLEHLATGRAGLVRLETFEDRLAEVDGRGACRHPDGVVRLIRSGLSVFKAHVAQHRSNGPCRNAGAPSVFPLPDARRRR